MSSLFVSNNPELFQFDVYFQESYQGVPDQIVRNTMVLLNSRLYQQQDILDNLTMHVLNGSIVYEARIGAGAAAANTYL